MRATLSDLAPYEAPPGGYANRLDSLSPAEQKAELLCEEERYYSLYKNEIEEEVYQGGFECELSEKFPCNRIATNFISLLLDQRRL